MMIKVTRLNKTEFFINPNLIEIMEETPNTVITLTNEKKYIVLEKTSEIVKSIIEFNRMIFLNKTRTE